VSVCVAATVLNADPAVPHAAIDKEPQIPSFPFCATDDPIDIVPVVSILPVLYRLYGFVIVTLVPSVGAVIYSPVA